MTWKVQCQKSYLNSTVTILTMDGTCSSHMTTLSSENSSDFLDRLQCNPQKCEMSKHVSSLLTFHQMSAPVRTVFYCDLSCLTRINVRHFLIFLEYLYAEYSIFILAISYNRLWIKSLLKIIRSSSERIQNEASSGHFGFSSMAACYGVSITAHVVVIFCANTLVSWKRWLAELEIDVSGWILRPNDVSWCHMSQAMGVSRVRGHAVAAIACSDDWWKFWIVMLKSFVWFAK